MTIVLKFNLNNALSFNFNRHNSKFFGKKCVLFLPNDCVYSFSKVIFMYKNVNLSLVALLLPAVL